MRCDPVSRMIIERVINERIAGQAVGEIEVVSHLLMHSDIITLLGNRFDSPIIVTPEAQTNVGTISIPDFKDDDPLTYIAQNISLTNAWLY
jgi:hypothetical protein